ncbi:hypothetical protein VB151_12755 [Xanthomonas fragariae]|uniref:hypothetical protein n=1 Tax=Xanthomonas fragariae TaxID=48664 RepID=UPI000326DB0E|nr:hypothetical protein [Xanthomonas fragariae]AOD16814.1 hypothetical protein BER92_19645 [Xanthomonas fragariae]AOD20210.1 hypothetical protein BER93_19695 [Xanthomonas fragariae]ENZ96498.1 hypothetical protein O1K_04481 [Xanthomonas fragariae LMG 25863]MBL9198784.1 hypothetical protein [Xanthomonas fragariae]MBL9223140.1 hypothetical protein [Xanthomonas fragariae]
MPRFDWDLIAVVGYLFHWYGSCSSHTPLVDRHMGSMEDGAKGSRLIADRCSHNDAHSKLAVGVRCRFCNRRSDAIMAFGGNVVRFNVSSAMLEDQADVVNSLPGCRESCRTGDFVADDICSHVVSQLLDLMLF